MKQYEGGRFLRIPDSMVLPASYLAGFDHEAGVGDQGVFDLDHAQTVLTSPLTWANEEYLIDVPAGTVVNGSTIPNIVYATLDGNAFDLRLPGDGHDALYRKDFVLRSSSTNDPVKYDRGVADKLYGEMCRNCGVDRDDVFRMVVGLRLFGASSYHQKLMSWRPALAAPHTWGEFDPISKR